jgi:hypothetical protein
MYSSGGETLSRSGSQSSLQTPDRASHSPMHSPHNSQPVNGGSMSGQSPAFSRSNNNASLDAAVMLRDFVNMQFGNPIFADVVVEFTELNAVKPSTVLPVHGFLLVRSATLLALLTQNSLPVTADNKKILQIHAPDKFILASEFVEVLRQLYGAPLLNGHDLVQGLRPFGPHDPETTAIVLQNMTRSLAHAAAGYFLGMHIVTSNALECAKQLLRWDTVERALSFALDGGLTPDWQARSRSRSAHERSSTPSDSPAQFTSFATYGEFSSQFLQSIVEFLASNFQPFFKFFASAPQLLEYPRLPTIRDSRPSVSDPRLSRIQFGEMSAEAIGRPDFVTTLLSSILISVPFPVLKVLLEHPVVSSKVGVPKIAEIMHLVIRERESRRQKVLDSKRVAAGPEASLMENTKQWERVDQSSEHASGFVLVSSQLGEQSATTSSSNDSANGTSGGNASVDTGRFANGHNMSDSVTSSWTDQVEDQSAVEALKLRIPNAKASGSVQPTSISPSTVDPDAATDLFFDGSTKYT